jgi:RNA polymerase sigma factor (TIGR02999 family)
MKADVTLLLNELSLATDRPRVQAAAELLAVLYSELRRLAASQLRNLRPGQTLTPTALVHEAYLRLVGDADPGWSGRGHFLGAATQAMRQIIVDAIRRKSAGKRGGGRPNHEMEADAVVSAADLDPDEALAIDKVLSQLAAEHPRKAQVVVMRYFGGLSEQEIAEALGVTARTVERDWRFARAYLHERLATEKT